MVNWSTIEFITILALSYLPPLPGTLLSGPISSIYGFFTTYQLNLFRNRSTGANHDEKVEGIQKKVRKWNRDGRKGRVCGSKSEPGSQTNARTIIETNLEDIIGLDSENKVVRVQPGVKVGSLISRLLPMGWTLSVVPVHINLTVGTCIFGTGLQSSSHKYGTFADTCIDYEIILSDGSLVRCSRDENSDLFYAMQWSRGTLGFLVGVTLPLIEAKRYVKVEYIPATSAAIATKLFEPYSGNEFVEGLMYDKSRIMVMFGNFTNQAPTFDKVNYIQRWYKPWFFEHAATFFPKPGKHVEYIPIQDYYFRHHRSVFWDLACLAPYGGIPVVQWLLGWILPLNLALLKAFTPLETSLKRGQISQEFVLPLAKFKETLDFTHDAVQAYPMWLCPVLMSPIPGVARNQKKMFVDFGVYEPAQTLKSEVLKKFEKFALATNGFQVSHAVTFESISELEHVSDTDLKPYKEIREKLKGDQDQSFPFPLAYDTIAFAGKRFEYYLNSIKNESK